MTAPLILPTHTPDLFRRAVQEAVDRLRRGELVALPTETVYGLAANALDPRAVEAIYQAKGRPSHNPIIVHVSNGTMARSCVSDWPELASRLARSFWPGPLTLVMPRATCIPDVVTAGGATVGIRWPSHPFMQAVIEACGFPLAAPSANLANQISPTSAAHVAAGLGNRIGLIVDGGQCQVGIESTVVDVRGPVLRVLRPGMIHEPALQAAAGGGDAASAIDVPGGSGPLRSPGLLAKHYAPHAPLKVWNWEAGADLAARIRQDVPFCRRPRVISHSTLPSGLSNEQVSVIPHDPEAFARALYSELHRCDEEGADLIVIEGVPHAAEWAGIADRLRRAAG